VSSSNVNQSINNTNGNLINTSVNTVFDEDSQNSDYLNAKLEMTCFDAELGNYQVNPYMEKVISGDIVPLSDEEIEQQIKDHERISKKHGFDSLEDLNNYPSNLDLISRIYLNNKLTRMEIRDGCTVYNVSNEILDINAEENIEIDKDYCEFNAAVDGDCDGLDFTLEYIFGTVSGLIDSDGDGYSDGAEVKSCYNPLGNGKMGINDFLSYCYKVNMQGIEYMEVLYEGYDEDMVKSMCKIWEPFGQQIIDGHLSNLDVSKLINSFPESDLYQEKCTQLINLVGEVPEEEGFICVLMQISMGNFCHGI